MTNRNDRIHNLILVSIFTAVAYICGILPSIKVSFLSLDIKDAFIAIGSLYLGPLPGVIISAVVSVLETVSGSITGFYGMIMNFFGSAAFVAVASLIYRNNKSLVNAVFALVCATFSMTLVMLCANLIFTPYYMGVTIDAVKGLIVPLFLPFNIAKGFLNSALVMLLYKPISVALKHARLAKDRTNTAVMNKNTLIVAIVATAVILLCLAFIFFELNGTVATES